jgi:molecular chaperone DnaK
LDTAAWVRLRDIAEKTKIGLSDQPFYQVAEAAILAVAGKPVNLHLEIKRREFEDLVGDLVEKTAEKVKDALLEAGLQPQDIGKILLVGGATRMPMVQNMLLEMFGRPIYHSIDPDLCVALGAATQGGLISGEPLGHILLDVTAHSLGIRTIDEIDSETGEADYFSVIIRRNTRIPTRQAEVYFTLRENQPTVMIEVYQGEKASCLENVPVGSFDFPIKPAPAHAPVIVEFAYDKEGLVHITVDQKGYQNQKEVTLDIRQKKIIDQESGAPAGKVVNYIIEKARNLLAQTRLPEDLKNNLNKLVQAYEQALAADEEGLDIDALEDELLSAIEDADERLLELG